MQEIKNKGKESQTMKILNLFIAFKHSFKRSVRLKRNLGPYSVKFR